MSDQQVGPATVGDGLKELGTDGVEYYQGRKHRASLSSRMIGGLQRESTAKSSWVVGILFLENDPGFDVIKSTLSKRILTIPRFRSVLKAQRFPYSKLDFVELGEEEMDMDYHIRKVLDGQSVTMDELNHWIGNMFDGFNHPHKEKPLWQISYVPKMDDGRACLITNISHVIGDGISQIETLMKLLDKQSLKKMESLRPPGKRKKKSFGPFTKAKIFMGGIFDGLFTVFGSPDPKNSLRLKNVTKPSEKKNCSFSQQLDLNMAKELKNKFEGATLNDILITLLTLTLRAYFNEVDDKVVKRGGQVRAQFPINLRGKNDEPFRNGSPRNYFAYGKMRFFLNDNKINCVDLLWKTKKSLDRMKHSPSPFVQLRSARIISKFMPLKMLNAQLLNAANISTFQLSNVPGPAGPAHFAGTEIKDLQFLLFGPIGAYVGIVTYNGKLSASFCLDSELPNPDAIAKHWDVEFNKFYSEAMAIEGTIPMPRGCCACL